MTDLYAIDVHCSLEACRTLDLLPIRCAGCNLVFCGPHAPSAQHGCLDIARAITDNVQDGKRFADKFEDLLPAPKRHAFEHDQMKQDQHARSTQAKKIIERNFGASHIRPSSMIETPDGLLIVSGCALRQVSSMSTAPPTKPSAAVKSAHTKPLSPVIALMKLKQRAQPIDAPAKRLKMEDRLYLTVRFCEGEERTVASTKEVWLGKESTGGKAIDQLARMFDVANVNNTTTDGTERLTLASSMNDDTCLPTSERLSQLVQNGTELVLMRGARFE